MRARSYRGDSVRMKELVSWFEFTRFCVRVKLFDVGTDVATLSFQRRAVMHSMAGCAPLVILN